MLERCGFRKQSTFYSQCEQGDIMLYCTALQAEEVQIEGGSEGLCHCIS